MAKLAKKGYAVCEGNILTSRTAGRIYSDFELDSTAFASGVKAENGMILEVNPVKKTVVFPATNGGILGLHLSSEIEYHQHGLNSFAVARETSDKEPNVSTQYPRIFRLYVGDVFTTNAVEMDTVSSDDLDAVATTPVYGEPSADGYIKLKKTLPTGALAFRVVKKTTLPDGQVGIKFFVEKA